MDDRFIEIRNRFRSDSFARYKITIIEILY